MTKSIPDFDCDGQIISATDLKGVLCEVKFTTNIRSIYSKKSKKKLNELYSGPPFMKPYLLWPVYPKIKSHKKVTPVPYKVALNEKHEIFSVIKQETNGVKECRLIDIVSQKDIGLNYACVDNRFLYKNLVAAINLACPSILQITNRKFPARYDGPLFEQYGKQRYIYPIFAQGLYDSTQAPGPYRVVMNSACKLVGVLKQDGNSKFSPCHHTKSSLIQNNI